MTISDSAQKELQGLIDDLCEGCLSDAQAERLQQMVCDDADAARYYCDAMNLHGVLLLEHAGSAETLPAASFAKQKPSSPPTPVQSFFSAIRRTLDFRSRPLGSSITIAALVMILSLTVLAIVRAPKPNVTRVVPAQDISVARISGMHRCRWVADTKPYSLGDPLDVNDRVQLTSGIVEITFRQGAVARLEGPAFLQIRSDRLARLQSGKLSARVIRRAAGFTVETPSVTVVDLGTEFAVNVPDHGGEEVHVFDGVVEVSLAQGGGQKFRLIKDQAVNISLPEGQLTAAVQSIPIGRSQFVKLLKTSSFSQKQPTGDSLELIINTFSDTTSQIAFPARDDDLINFGQPTYDAPGSYAVGYETGVFERGKSSIEGLNDGRLGTASTLSPENTWSNDDRDGFSRTFSLDTRIHKDGYDVTEIRTIAGWVKGRFEQKYAVSYSTVEEPSRFIPLATVDHTHSGATQNVSTLVQLLCESGPIATSVKAIRFHFQTGGSTVWREVDVLGHSSANVAP